MRANLISHCHFHVCMVAWRKLDLLGPFHIIVSDSSVLGSKRDSWFELRAAWCLDPGVKAGARQITVADALVA